MAIETKGVPAMSDIHDLQVRAGDLERAITETDDRHGSLLSGLERGLSQLRERLVGATAANDRLVHENTELRAIAEQLLSVIENKPAETLHDKLAALDGQLHGLLELSGDQGPANRAPVSGTAESGTAMNGTPAAVGHDGGALSESAAEAASEATSESAGGPFEEIRDRMRALSSQLLAPAEPSAAPSVAAQAQGSTRARNPAPVRSPAAGPPPNPGPGRHARRDPGSPRAFDRPIRALAEKAQNVLPKARLRFDAETGYALTILRRIGGGGQPFGIEEVRDLINGKFGLSLTDRDDAQLAASLANQDGLTRAPRGGDAGGVPSWRFEKG